MAFSSGASSKRRKALQAAAAQYYEAFSKLTEVANPKRVETSTSADLASATNDQASFRVRKMAKDSDRLARQFNRDDSFQSKADAYNDRYAILKEQMANRAAVRYTVGDLPMLKSTGPLEGNLTIRLGAPDPNAGRYVKAFSDGAKTYSSREEAMAAAAEKFKQYQQSPPSAVVPANPGILGIGQPSYAPVTAADFVQETVFQPFGALYRNLGVAEDAAADFNRLGAAVSSSSGGQALEKYAAITAKLKPLVEKEASRSALNASPTGLIADQLAAELDTGVLK